MNSKALTLQQQIDRSRAILIDIAQEGNPKESYHVAKQIAATWCKYPSALTREVIRSVPPRPNIFRAFVEIGEQCIPSPDFIAIYVAKCAMPLVEGLWGELEGVHANYIAALLFQQRHSLAMRYADSVSSYVSLPAILGFGASIDDVVYCVVNSPYCVAGAKLAIESAVEGQDALVYYFRELAVRKLPVLKAAIIEWKRELLRSTSSPRPTQAEITERLIKFLAAVCTTPDVQDAVLHETEWPEGIVDDTVTYLINTRGACQVSTTLLIDRLLICSVMSPLALEIAKELVSPNRFPEWSYRFSVMDKAANVFFAQKTFVPGIEDMARLHTSNWVVRAFAYAPSEKAQQYLGSLLSELKNTPQDELATNILSTVLFVLRYHHHDWARDYLLEMARSDQPKVRQAAMDSLREWADDPKVQELLTTSKS